MSDLYWFLIMMLFMNPHEQNEKAKGDNKMDELKNTFKKTIEQKLSNPDITAKEIQELACAYSELTKNDWMREFANRTSGLGIGFNGPSGYENAQLT